MPSNTAAWQPKPGVPYEVQDTPYTSPPADCVVIKNHVVALNPIDFLLQDKAYFPTLSYPTILGLDVAGEVVEVGSEVSSRLKLGDRVLALAGGVSSNNPSRAAFQEYTVVVAKLVTKIPDSLSYNDAAVLPLGLATAACGLFQDDQLALQSPSLSPKSTGQTILVWSGASSVGVNAIQLGVAAGYEVITTASPKNFELVRSLGASEVFDHNADPATLLEQLTNAFKAKTLAGVLHTAGDASGPISICAELFARVEGNKFFTTTVLLPEDMPANFKHNRVFATTITNNGIGEAIFVDFLTQALSDGKFKAAPQAEVVGNGLESLQKGVDILRKGVSAKKLIVTLN
ncbi:oxidoreductase, partial [Aureobasidium melanogenum]